MAWCIPGEIADFSRDFSAYKTQTYTRPLSSQSPAEARAMAIAEAARMCDEYPLRDPAEDGNGYWAAEECAKSIRALSSPPSVSEEWVQKQLRTIPAQINMADALLAVRATLAALGVEVKS